MSKTNASYHAQSGDEVLQALSSRSSGLTDDEVSARLQQYGPNKLPQAPQPGTFTRFIKQFANLLVIVLIVAGVLTALLQHWIDTFVIFGVVIVNAIIGVIQEGKAEKAMDSIRNMLALKAAVIRNGKRRTLEGDSLVPGDIVLLEAGDKVPADLRLLRSHGLAIQESLLTGESLPVEKHTKAVSEDAGLGDRECLAFSGTSVTAGQGMGVVIATGATTEIGRIGGLLSDVQKLTTPLVEQMDVLAKWITGIILAIAVVLLLVGTWILEQPFTELFLAVVGLSVAAIPEGLPAVLTITLAVGVQSMAKRNAIVRVLPAIETLGSVSVICSDKTGTFTRNEMMVVSAVTQDAHFEVDGEGYAPVGDILLDGEPAALQQHQILRDMARLSALCNDAEIHSKSGQWGIEGDPMEAALLSFAGKVTMPDGGDFRHDWPRTDVLPFDSARQFMATLNHNHNGTGLVLVKGAPEVILKRCGSVFSGDGSHSDLVPEAWLDKAEALARQGQRVLALAGKQVSAEHTVLAAQDVDNGLCLLGLVGLIDPPRQEAIEAVKTCRAARIQVKMITGDHAVTAQAIGKQLGLAHGSVLTGTQLDALSDDELKQAVQSTDIFARTTPEHKLRLVMALQSLGLTVSMTGDGVNDAPSLKRADAGVAMGLKGSEAAKEAAEVVLADDNFASIAAAVEQGRTVYANIKKVVSWTLPTNAGEALTIIVAMLAGLPYPITPVQILWVNMITAVTLGMALAFEPTDKDTMKKPPRPRGQALIQPALVWQIMLVGSLFFLAVFSIYQYAIETGHEVEYARTQAMNMLVGLEIFYLFFIRTMHRRSISLSGIRGTRVVWSAVGFVVIAQLAICYIPVLQTVFGTRAPDITDNLLIVLTGIVMLIVLEMEKVIRLNVYARVKK
ncbi:MAG: HAD-IC family P-type ATPase [Aestuariibacter sp.]|uniref:cation-translocating P-type ATPase n=1 Tax=Marisediminitalea aggregata TaxID=634436 RepID=UPI0020CFC987|nr:HAD-IC family P-type ATPase [Marisediminitalea aggregata]MCP4525346.1 HAD-IC family P-type ATPase [Aestuariibacter sp.]MCP9477025.1 HAD-IC family P-type ATPase [Marisediminitalea aggregata]